MEEFSAEGMMAAIDQADAFANEFPVFQGWWDSIIDLAAALEMFETDATNEAEIERLHSSSQDVYVALAALRGNRDVVQQLEANGREAQEWDGSDA